MSGKYAGVQTSVIKQHCPHATFIPHAQLTPLILLEKTPLNVAPWPPVFSILLRDHTVFFLLRRIAGVYFVPTNWNHWTCFSSSNFLTLDGQQDMTRYWHYTEVILQYVMCWNPWEQTWSKKMNAEWSKIDLRQTPWWTGISSSHCYLEQNFRTLPENQPITSRVRLDP